jgi:hypothetical protein
MPVVAQPFRQAIAPRITVVKNTADCNLDFMIVFLFRNELYGPVKLSLESLDQRLKLRLQ